MTDEIRLIKGSQQKIKYAEPFESQDYDTQSQKWHERFCIPTRYIMAIWGFLGFAVVYILRVNLSVAIIAMVNSSSLHDNMSINPECTFPTDNKTQSKPGKFVWDQELQGIILGAFFWGYIPLQVPAGWLAVKIGGKWLFGFGVLWTSVWTLLTPIAAETHYGWLIALRVMEGAGESITYPAMHSMLGYWAPAMETSFLGGIVYSGSFAGLVIGLLVSGFLIDANIMGGWPSVFYIPGLVGIAWFAVWSFVAYSKPGKHPRISDSERQFIESSVNLSCEEMSNDVPWKKIFTSLPVWAVSVANFCSMWSLYTLLTSLPQYFEYILGFSISANGYLNALPYLLSAMTFLFAGKMADVIRSHNWMNTTNTRKFFNTTGMVVNAIFIVAISYIGCNRGLVVTFLCIAVAIGQINSAGYNVNHIDLAPQYAGVLYGLTNSIATVSGIVGPYVVGVLTNEKETREQWKIVFYISSAITLFGAAFYFIFGSGERQPWALDRENLDQSSKDS